LRSNGRVRGTWSLPQDINGMTRTSARKRVGKCVAPNRRTIPVARKLRREFTNAEWKLWAELRNRQLGNSKFVRQEPVGDYVADFVCRERRLIVEVDGATHSTDEELRRDAARTEFLERHGYRVVRFQNEDVYDAMEGVLQTILLALEEER
jgi:very-short-patch-repair endonuclease